jgi:hypothetical protein
MLGVEAIGKTSFSVLVHAKANNIPKAKITLFIIYVLIYLFGLFKYKIYTTFNQVPTIPPLHLHYPLFSL